MLYYQKTNIKKTRSKAFRNLCNLFRSCEQVEYLDQTNTLVQLIFNHGVKKLTSLQ